MDENEIALADAADLVGLSPSSLKAAARRGELLARKLNPRMWLVKPADVIAWKMRHDAGKQRRGPKPKQK